MWREHSAARRSTFIYLWRLCFSGSKFPSHELPAQATGQGVNAAPQTGDVRFNISVLQSHRDTWPRPCLTGRCDIAEVGPLAPAALFLEAFKSLMSPKAK
ncbi:hypothetical protein SKAU_G00301920 [Synaphobranchus kaupii]|uniref:Uncharacterized protein n=1 Tax=Synaphobranchus kaupii TaxID=118154 RepID=A0A9Q1EVU2_SYNKA|nr:hypothetical protein SKAU_G00301920 [Synaphobranchus kaupii]